MGRPRLNFQLGVDLGNGNIKIATDNYVDRIPSYIDNCPVSDAVGSVQIKGENSTSFCVGYSASKSHTSTPTTNDKSAKITGINRLYLGAVAHIPNLPKTINNQIVVSSHAWQSHKDVIKDNLTQSLECKLSGVDVSISTEVLMVVPEGFGAIAFMPDQRKATLDFGTGTTLLTPYTNQKPQESIKSNAGVYKLIQMVCETMQNYNNGYPGEPNEIRRCLEQGTFKTIDGYDFKNIYNKCLSQWWNEFLLEVRTEASRLLTDGYKIVCIGGGVALPGFKKVLTAKKFELVEGQPEMVSAIGMYQLAMKKVGAVNA